MRTRTFTSFGGGKKKKKNKAKNTKKKKNKNRWGKRGTKGKSGKGGRCTGLYLRCVLRRNAVPLLVIFSTYDSEPSRSDALHRSQLGRRNQFARDPTIL